jgi:hypothetical protein
MGKGGENRKQYNKNHNVSCPASVGGERDALFLSGVGIREN